MYERIPRIGPPKFDWEWFLILVLGVCVVIAGVAGVTSNRWN